MSRTVHLKDVEFAHLLEGRGDPSSWHHLETCMDCWRIYESALRGFAGATPSKIETDLPEAVVAAARAIPQRRTTLESSQSTRRRRFTWTASAFATAAVLLILVLPQMSKDHFIVPLSIQTALNTTSAQGLVYPGSEESADDAVIQYRSGGENAILLKDDLDLLLAKVDRGGVSADHYYYTIAACLEAVQMELAEDLLLEAQAAYPSEPRIQMLGALIDYRRNNDMQALAVLRQLTGQKSVASVAWLNLGIMLAETGDIEGARKALTSAQMGNSKILSARAQTEFDQLDSR